MPLEKIFRIFVLMSPLATIAFYVSIVLTVFYGPSTEIIYQQISELGFDYFGLNTSNESDSTFDFPSIFLSNALLELCGDTAIPCAISSIY